MLDNLSPRIWGDTFWKTGYLITYVYPANPTNEDKNTVVNFFNQFKKILPCEKCRNHYEIHLQKFPLNDKSLANKYSLMVWLLNMHNEVNKSLGKKILTLNEIYDKYIIDNQSDNKIKTYITLLLLFLIIIIVIIYILLKKKY